MHSDNAAIQCVRCTLLIISAPLTHEQDRHYAQLLHQLWREQTPPRFSTLAHTFRVAIYSSSDTPLWYHNSARKPLMADQDTQTRGSAPCLSLYADEAP